MELLRKESEADAVSFAVEPVGPTPEIERQTFPCPALME